MKMLQTASGYLQKYYLKDFTNHRKKTNQKSNFRTV